MNKPDNPARLVGEKIRSAREEMGLSQIELAKELGFESATAVSLIENGERNLSTENLVRLSKILQRDVKYFLGIEEDKTSVAVALRADKDLAQEDKDALLRFVELAKMKRNARKS
jgi:transcriptional regulator with XRE-family HTH domain